MSLKALPHPHLPAFYTPGSGLRARALQSYLEGLHRVYAALKPLPPVRLYLLGEKDWQGLLPYPYGLPFQRTGPDGLSLYAPARYPERLLHRLREVLLPVGAPGNLEAFLDLILGHEYAHAVQVAWGLRTGRRWLDELLANYLFLYALGRAYPNLAQDYLAWAERLARLEPENPRLSAYDRRRTRLKDALWFQGVLTLKARDLPEDLLGELLQAQTPKAVHRLLVERAPGLACLPIPKP